MAKENNILEEAIIQMKNLEEAVAENAKGILASTMKQEIKDLVKESLNEEDDEEEIDFDADVADVDTDFDDEEYSDDEEDDTEEYSDEEEDGTEEYSDDDDEEVLDLRHLDQMGMSKEESSEVVMKVFKALGPNDQIKVEKDIAGNIHLTDDNADTEYMIVGENYHMDEDYMEEDYMSMDEEMYESDMYESDMYESDMYESDMYEKEEPSYERELSMFDNLEENLYEVEMDEDFMEESLYESKKSFKAKGQDFGNAQSYKMSPKPNMEGGFKVVKTNADKTMGTGSAKSFKYGKVDKGDFSIKPKHKKETKESMMKKIEATEASRTLGNGKYWGREGLPKPKAAPRHLRNESVDSIEMEVLREKNEEYRKALNVFRNKLNEVAVFNSNLAYATRLFTEHSTSKQEKINILKRFDDVESLKESKTLYKIIKDELSSSKPQQVTESIDRTINRLPSNGSAINLIESKTYENPQFLRMKDLMGKLK